MRHSVFGRKLSRTKNERRRLFASLLRDLIIHDSIISSVAKVKAVQPIIEKLITKAKEGSEHSRRAVFAVLTDRKLTEKLFEDAKTRYANRSSGFTRRIPAGRRLGDATETSILQFVDARVETEVIAPKPKAAVAKSPGKKPEAKGEKKPAEVKKAVVKKAKKA